MFSYCIFIYEQRSSEKIIFNFSIIMYKQFAHSFLLSP